MDGRPKRIKKFAFTSVCVYNRLRVEGALDLKSVSEDACFDDSKVSLTLPPRRFHVYRIQTQCLMAACQVYLMFLEVQPHLPAGAA